MDFCIANFACLVDVETLNEDPDTNLGIESSPQFHSATANPTQDWINTLKEAATDEWEYTYEEDDLENVIWEDSGWVTPKQGRAHRTIYANIGEELIGCITIQKEVLV